MMLSFSVLFFLVFVFFSKQKTAYEMRISYWSSDVCSSDLHLDVAAVPGAFVQQHDRAGCEFALQPCHDRGWIRAHRVERARVPGHARQSAVAQRRRHEGIRMADDGPEPARRAAGDREIGRAHV